MTIEDQIMDLHNKGWSSRQIGQKVGRGKSTVNDIIRRMKDVIEGNHPEKNISGRSTLYKTDEDGNRFVLLEWVKESEQKKNDQLKEVLEGFKDELEPVFPVARVNKPGREDLLNCYVLTDAHIGMLAWGEECGDDWDTDIAEDRIVRFFEQAIENSPEADSCVFAQLGDFLHYDSFEAITPANKNVLDADTRYHSLVRVAIRVVRKITSLLLQKYGHVHMIMCEGNHDPVSSVWLTEMFDTLYDLEDRITVDTSPNPYHVYQWGDTSLFFTHGHLKKRGAVDQVFAGQYREVYGNTKFSYAHTGHLHNQQVSETNLMIVEQHNTLSNRDAYAARHGFGSLNNAKVITYSKDFGEVARITVSSQMLETCKSRGR